ncbi:metallophosphoesterase family protein [Sphaerobacter sp.]|uniref:metallophosphoesterase family protein n=1 Tax=Sphaerobacter sp. TaxID=2099654 RepID=UPI001D6CD2A6|nr:metallophosphoesterase family protein [Sphaerobacter sp.]MBX5444577.1 metallophosphoesterase family protein [Sphaerobacter sp.]
MRFGRRVGIIGDVHGADGLLTRALAACRAAGVETVALLGDLFDRLEQADAVARALDGWHIVGVRGNHEREALLATSGEQRDIRPATAALLCSLQDRVILDDVCLVHEEDGWGRHDPVATLFGGSGWLSTRHYPAWITFAGHTHVRHARDERGPLDIGRGSVTLVPYRRYLINPGALVNGQFAIWDREGSEVKFCDLKG